MNIDGSVGRSLLKRAVGDESRFASEPQFHLKRCEDNATWLIKQEPKALNPTLIDGIAITCEGTKLAAGSEITIGPDKARLRVKIEF